MYVCVCRKTSYTKLGLKKKQLQMGGDVQKGRFKYFQIRESENDLIEFL